MKFGAVYLGARNLCLVQRVWKTANAWERARGLLGRPPLASNEGLLIDHCNMVHTIGMRYAIDLVFLDGTGHVQKLVHNLRPLRCTASFSSKSTLELPAGSLVTLGLHLGEKLSWQADTL